MTFEQLMKSRQATKIVKTVKTTDDIMHKLNIEKTTILGNRIVDDMQKEQSLKPVKQRGYAAIVSFDDLGLTDSLIIRANVNDLLDGEVATGSDKYQFKVKDSSMDYGIVSIYATSYVVALEVLKHYLGVAKHKTGKGFQYKDTNTENSYWKGV